MTKIIALSGWKQSGKDTVADFLESEAGFIRFSFAGALKDMVAAQYDIPRSWCDDPDYKEKALSQYPVDMKDGFSEKIGDMLFKEFRPLGSGPNPYNDYEDYDGRDPEIMAPLFWTPRALCILEGSIKRSVTSSFWVQRVVDVIKKTAAMYTVEGDYNKFVISDLRYRSEIAQLQAAFGDDLQIVRVERFDDIDSTDPSERDLDNFKFSHTIENKGSLDELYEKVISVCG